MYYRLTFSKFLVAIEGQYEILSKHVKRQNTLAGVTMSNLIDLPYIDLKHNVPAMIKNGEIEKAIHLILSSKKRVNFGKIRRSSNYDKFGFLMWIQDEYKKIRILEQTKLSGEANAEMARAGVAELNVLGDFYMINTIALRYNYTHEEAYALPYNVIFDIQHTDAIERRISRRKAENEKNK